MTINVGSNKACAACKYQRRRCSKDCPLAPYFPSNKPETFSNAHRLFGVSNITRILNHVEPHQKDEAMKSIIFESDVRAKFPVQGCYGLAMYYNYMINKTEEELHDTKMLVENFKEYSQVKQHHTLMPLVPTMSIDPCSILPTRSNEFPIYNRDKDASLFDPNLGLVYGANDYMQKNDIYMETLTCMSDIINDVNTSFLDEKSTSMSMDGSSYHENQLESIALENNTRAMDARSSKFNLMEELESSYHSKQDIPKYYHGTTHVDEFGDNIRAFVDCKDACRSFSHYPASTSKKGY
ncbi:hypothetical protein TanjilG_08303 [Lupinus angustifolius]|nr:hypothetical protein TanjilG_08303 [Lupinus angustifolius]